MTLFYCGWNGCGQISGCSNIISKATRVTLDSPIVSVSCSWSTLTIATERSLTAMGFIGNKAGFSRKITLGNNCHPVEVSSCLNRTLVACDNGNCYSYNTEHDVLSPISDFTSSEVSNLEQDCLEVDPITKVRCSDYCTLALTKSGRIFNIPSPIFLPNLKVTDISCGNEHNLLLTNTGSVYTWGNGSRGQLGHGDLEAEESPRLVEALAGIQVLRVSAGAWHSAVVTSCGDLYTWGWGSDGQLGLEEDEVEVNEEDEPPTKRRKTELNSQALLLLARDKKFRGIVQACPVPVDTFTDVDMVSCGSRHTVVLLVDGSVWGCGWNAYGQLACPPEECIRSTLFKQICIPDFQGKISKIQCGGWSSCFIESIKSN